MLAFSSKITYTWPKIMPVFFSKYDLLGRPLVQTGKKENTRSIIWSYTFTSEFTDVFEEYLVYDTTGIIGSVGGTLGLFVGFSFRDVIFYLIDYLKDFINLRH